MKSSAIKQVSLAIILFISLVSSAQEKAYFINKTSQSSISIEPLAISYTYVHKFAPKLRLGARIQIGFGTHFHISYPPSFQTQLIDLLNIQLLYRFPLKNYIYSDLSLLVTYNTFLGSMDSQQGNTYGLGITTFYKPGKFYIGFSLQARFFDYWYYEYDIDGNHLNTKYETKYTFVISPLIIGLGF